MGLAGSHHIRVGGECYDLDEKELPMGYVNTSVFTLFPVIVLIIFFLVLWYASKNKIFLFIAGIISFFEIFGLIESYQKKRSIAKEYGKKVDCPKPLASCDDDYEIYKKSVGNDEGWLPYTCDERLKYS
jgi:hypothetical protein